MFFTNLPQETKVSRLLALDSVCRQPISETSTALRKPISVRRRSLHTKWRAIGLTVWLQQAV